MDNNLAKGAPKIQADNQSIAIGEINITSTVTGNITIGHTIVHRAACRRAPDVLDGIVTTWLCQESAGKVGVAAKKIAEKAKEETK